YATLDRGYAIVQQNGSIVSSVAAVKSGDPLDIRVKDGAFRALVGGPMPATQRRSKRAVSDAQAPLFTMPEERA
ncbi:MAG: exodeoxyribonuclease VII large subunit, partial [Chloroflexi bacterium]|nr:exodeoxyribonuclease VII large subunit [Chloroflexota bacterium]